MKKSYTHYMCCRDCGQVVTLIEDETVKMWPNGYPVSQFSHGCGEGRKGRGTTAPKRIPDGPYDREQALAALPLRSLHWR